MITPSIRAAVRDFYADAITRNDLTLFHTLDPHLTYLENNGHLMRYARLRKVGLPVGSDVTEGACKSAIEMRTNGSGQRWRPEGLEAVLTLRAVHRSDRLPRFWANLTSHGPTGRKLPGARDPKLLPGQSRPVGPAESRAAGTDRSE